MKREYGIWRTDACDRCGNEFQVTRTQPRVVENGEELVCSDCSIYEDAEKQSADAIESLRAEVARLRGERDQAYEMLAGDESSKVEHLRAERNAVTEERDALRAVVESVAADLDEFDEGWDGGGSCCPACGGPHGDHTDHCGLGLMAARLRAAIGKGGVMSDYDDLDEVPECERCGETYVVDDGCDPTPHCHLCAHVVVEELQTEVARLREERDKWASTAANVIESRDALRAVVAEQANCAQRAWKRGTDIVTHAEIIGIERALRAALGKNATKCVKCGATITEHYDSPDGPLCAVCGL